MAWAFAKAGLSAFSLFAAVAKDVVQRLSEFSAQDIVILAWAFAEAGQSDTPLFEALAKYITGILGNIHFG